MYYGLNKNLAKFVIHYRRIQKSHTSHKKLE